MTGKGGVGKTTTAGALALALAEQGRSTCLLSTDPAHSLGDLFGTRLPPGRPTPCPCCERLFLEEVDAETVARGWTLRARQPLLELVERGTYLDREEVTGFLDLTLPGVDEVAGMLRLAEVADGPWERVVVDTAPTGHTLRLLDAEEVVRSWSGVFGAMAEKVRAVFEQLTRRPLRLDAEDVLEELAGRVARFRGAAVECGAAVLVDRAGTLVEAESQRLHDELEARGLPVALRIRVASRSDEPDPGPGVLTVPFRTDIEGCDGLRRWGHPPSGTVRHGRPAAPGEAIAFLRALPELVLFVGKGGVGKTTCAAAAALALAQDRDVTLLGTDPAGSLEDVLRLALLDGEGVLGRLRVRQVRAAAEFAEIRARYRESVAEAFGALGTGGGAALDRRVVEAFLELAPPGMDEAFAVAALVDDAEEGRTIVVDTAPTGHFLRLAAMPGLALSWTRQLLGVVRRHRAVLGLDAFAEGLLDFARRLRELDRALSDPLRSAAILVTQPGPLVTSESSRLLERLEGRVRLAAILANRTEEGEPGLLVSPGKARLRAPFMEVAPVGPEALDHFLRTWRVLP